MTAFAISDCIRATPGRTLGALLLLAVRAIRRAVRSDSVQQPDERGQISQ